jgi:hypothetical protein
VLPGAITEPPKTLVPVGSSSSWGGPRIKWIDPLTPGLRLSSSMTSQRKKEWGSFTGELRGVAHSLSIRLPS